MVLRREAVEPELQQLCDEQARPIEEFWSIYNYLVRPHDLPTTALRSDDLPTFERPANATSGPSGSGVCPVSLLLTVTVTVVVAAKVMFFVPKKIGDE